ncbi:hypothetical protein EMCRGX_G004699 [Ephydatia muelleri]|eukprot:Em0007g647a
MEWSRRYELLRVMNSVLVLRVALSFAVGLLLLRESHQSSCPSNADTSLLEPCRSRSCLVCRNVPAACTVDSTNRIVSCVGDASQCSGTVECDPCSRCLAYYGGNGTVFRFSSACISMDYPFDCGSVPAECERSDEVTGGVGWERALFHSNKLWCSCHGESCTAQLAFRYSVSNGSGVPAGGYVSTSWKDPLVSPSLATSHMQDVPMQQMDLQAYELAIAVLSCVLIVCLAIALVLVGLRARKLILQRRSALVNNSYKFQKFEPLE